MSEHEQMKSTVSLPEGKRVWEAPKLSVMDAGDAELGATPARPEGLAFGS